MAFTEGKQQPQQTEGQCPSEHGQYQTQVDFKLQHIESQLDEATLLAAEKLLERSEIPAVHQTNGGLWVVSFPPFEVEVQLRGIRVQSYTCDCPAHQSRKLCEHVGAALFLLRRGLSSPVASAPPTAPASTEKLTVNTILENARADDLQAFVRYYARKNRLFALELKMRFASAVPSQDNLAKYQQILDSAVKLVTTRKGNIPPLGGKQLDTLITLLNNQARDALAFSNFSDAFAMLQVSLQRGPSLLVKCADQGELLLKILRESAGVLIQLSRKDLAPELRVALLKFCLQQLQRHVVKENRLLSVFLGITITIAIEKREQQRILALITANWKDASLTLDLKLQLLLEILPAVKSYPWLSEFIHCAPAELDDAWFLFRGAQMALEQQRFTVAISFGNAALGQPFPKESEMSCRETVLNAAVQSRQSRDIVQQAIWLFRETGDERYYQLLKQHGSTRWKELLPKLLDSQDGETSLLLRATVLAAEAQWETLLALLGKTADLEVLPRFTPPLYASHPEAVVHLYQELLRSYLSEYFGPVPAKKVQDLLQQLIALGCAKLAARLRGFVLRHFPSKLVPISEE